MDLVLIPCYMRPEFLALCIEHLSACPEFASKRVIICHDRRKDDAERFPIQLEHTRELFRRLMCKIPNLEFLHLGGEGGYGNTFNVLEAYKYAYNSGARYIYLIEDDVFVTPDFFSWHEKMQASNIFCTIAGFTDSELPYASLGVCWNRENLSRVIEHAKVAYYKNLDGYLLETFPNSKYGAEYVEQDGLIARIIERDNLFAVWADSPKAYHLGLYGYHRSIGEAEMLALDYNGDFDTLVENLRAKLADPVWIEKVTTASGQKDIQMYPSALRTNL